METTRPSSPRRLARAVVAVLILGGGTTSCRGQAADDATPIHDGDAVAARIAAIAPGAAAREPSTGARAPGAGRRAAPGFAAADTSLRVTPDLLADLEPRVSPATAARLRGARDAGRVFAGRVAVDGPAAQGIADVLTELAFDVARAEQEAPAGGNARVSAVQRAAQDAMDALRWLVPTGAIADAEREILRWTGDVSVAFVHPSAAEWARTRAMVEHAPASTLLP